MLRKLLLAATAAIALGSTAQARTIDVGFYGSWRLMATFDDRTGGFTGCGIAMTYTTGHTLLLSGSMTELTIGIGHPSWRLNPGWNYPIDVQIDSLRFHTTRTTAIDHDLIMAYVGPYAIRPLGMGNWITIQPLNVTLSLAGSRVAMLAMADCITNYSGSSNTSPSNPWARI